MNGGNETLLASQATAVKVSTGTKLNVDGMATGTNPVKLSVRTWVNGASKPGWQQTFSDSSGSRISSAGAVRVYGYLSAAATGSGTVSFANATASAVTSTTSPTPAPSTGKPTADTTGVPAGTSLTRHDGDIIVDQDGTVLRTWTSTASSRQGQERHHPQLDRPRRPAARALPTGLITNSTATRTC